jgi:hypothetical protein
MCHCHNPYSYKYIKQHHQHYKTEEKFISLFEKSIKAVSALTLSKSEKIRKYFMKHFRIFVQVCFTKMGWSKVGRFCPMSPWILVKKLLFSEVFI